MLNLRTVHTQATPADRGLIDGGREPTVTESCRDNRVTDRLIEGGLADNGRMMVLCVSALGEMLERRWPLRRGSWELDRGREKTVGESHRLFPIAETERSRCRGKEASAGDGHGGCGGLDSKYNMEIYRAYIARTMKPPRTAAGGGSSGAGCILLGIPDVGVSTPWIACMRRGRSAFMSTWYDIDHAPLTTWSPPMGQHEEAATVAGLSCSESREEMTCVVECMWEGVVTCM